ncbi:hypothetical protein PRIPAC_70365 [Pristionchus pacificus]|uniref:Uncharacterized protein n=1 Tax=Pristionchus pacificus TaxID=54126 RepID=A0A2A6C7B1_PRIPA|nr:hypothetical protein PRIPAC_70365 [Pristionchus pacificus]|eukprot:PDM73990.1 hypothetical protein PRIPAC_41346 [Pristionchus pacificus]
MVARQYMKRGGRRECTFFPAMSNTLLFVFLLVALLSIAVVNGDFTCTMGEWMCKDVTCRSCKVATCITGDCVCTLCS